MAEGSRVEVVIACVIAVMTLGLFLWGTTMFGMHYNEVRDRDQARECQEMRDD